MDDPDPLKDDFPRICADMKSQCWFGLCCVVGLIFCVVGLLEDSWGKTGIPIAGVNPPKSHSSK